LLVAPVHEHGKRQQAASGHQYDQPEDEKPLRKPSQRFHNDPFTCRRSSELTSRFDMPDDEAAGLGCRSQTTRALPEADAEFVAALDNPRAEHQIQSRPGALSSRHGDGYPFADMRAEDAPR
jgi:hypothetical protein